MEATSAICIQEDSQRLSVEAVIAACRPKWEKLQYQVRQEIHAPETAEYYLLGYKQEKMLELYIRSGSRKFSKNYVWTADSGQQGPKLQEGDGQVPEGIYTIEYLNPASRFHLSLKMNYPNAFDREMAALDGRENLGGDIFIHGKNTSTGCIAIGDEMMEELFSYVALTGPEQFTIAVFPFRLEPGKTFVPMQEMPSWTSRLYKELTVFYQQLEK